MRGIRAKREWSQEMTGRRGGRKVKHSGGGSQYVQITGVEGGKNVVGRRGTRYKAADLQVRAGISSEKVARAGRTEKSKCESDGNSHAGRRGRSGCVAGRRSECEVIGLLTTEPACVHAKGQDKYMTITTNVLAPVIPPECFWLLPAKLGRIKRTSIDPRRSHKPLGGVSDR